MTQTQTRPRPARIDRLAHRTRPRPLVPTEALIVGFLLALLAVGLLGVWAGAWVRSL